MLVAVAQSPADLSFPIRTSYLIAIQLEKPLLASAGDPPHRACPGLCSINGNVTA